MHLTSSPTSLTYHRSSSRRLRHPLRQYLSPTLFAATFASSTITPLGRSPPLPLTPTDLPPALTWRTIVPITYAAAYNPIAGKLS
jgi:hypothetical protein